MVTFGNFDRIRQESLSSEEDEERDERNHTHAHTHTHTHTPYYYQSLLGAQTEASCSLLVPFYFLMSMFSESFFFSSSNAEQPLIKDPESGNDSSQYG